MRSPSLRSHPDTRRSDHLQGKGSIFIPRYLKTLDTVSAEAGEAQKDARRPWVKRRKKQKREGWEENFPGPAPILFPAFLVSCPPPAWLEPLPSAVLQTDGALPAELINLTRAINVSLLKRYDACDVFSDISVPSIFHLYCRGLFSKFMDESFESCGWKTMLVNFNLNKTIFAMKNQKTNGTFQTNCCVGPSNTGTRQTKEITLSKLCMTFVCLAPVRWLSLSSMVVLYHVNG